MFELREYLMPLALILLVLVAYKALKSRNDDEKSRIDFDDLLLDEHRRFSKVAVILLCALFVTSWGFILLILRDKMTDTIFIGYGAIWVTPLLTKIWKGADTTSANAIAARLSAGGAPSAVDDPDKK